MGGRNAIYMGAAGALLVSQVVSPVALAREPAPLAAAALQSANLAQQSNRGFGGSGSSQGGNFGGSGGSWQYGGYKGQIDCAAAGRQERRCRVSTGNRVTLIKRHSGQCKLNRDWGFNSRNVWVRNDCRATFAYGYGNFRPGDYGHHDEDKGPNAGLVIGGAVIAAGLIALLASKKKKDDNYTHDDNYRPGRPAAIQADLNLIPANARQPMQRCLNEAAKQVGAVGGTVLRLDSLDRLDEAGSSSWRFDARTTISYDGAESQAPMRCRATSRRVLELDFIN
ncbi:DUF3011 domain-containing protein [Altererythrobacter sp. H2]|uniref:DUF3011 domain-containing protein n=1 Tax=Altererythrobacter sp. H2 TaxID=3108391 RepID=UPI002B4BB2C6|nr:DUF3011 domain-containing protein [Altererythrobacter sp. H2]WRK96723.1 DUF3011 domain-containing protein [Altererythrobacter sp. H2]